MGRATYIHAKRYNILVISIHALRGEGDLYDCCLIAGIGISIHALRGEGDVKRRKFVQSRKNFNPRPPWGGRRQRFYVTNFGDIISIHALRGEGDCYHIRYSSISMYFNPRPPWGGRLGCSTSSRRTAPFQSTPSVGRATEAASRKSVHEVFQSTPSVGRATFSLLEFVPLYDISIHALRGEGDI